MSNWSIPSAGRTETLGAGTGEGTTVTSGTANVKGSYATLGTTGFAYAGFLLSLVYTNGARYRVDVAVNNGGSDQIVVANWFADWTNSLFGNQILPLPIGVPAGASVKVRCQAHTGAQALRALVTGYATDFPGFRRARSLVPLGTFSSTDPAASVTQAGTSWTAWTEVAASTPERVSGLYVAAGSGGDTSRTASRVLVEIGTGAAGSEVALGMVPFWQTAIAQMPQSPAGPFPFDLPAGRRLAFRAQCAAAAADTLTLAVHGLVP